MEWFLYKSGQVEGPLSQLELLAKINNGEINDDELMCKKGDDQWKTLKDFRPELFIESAQKVETPPAIRDWILLSEKMAVDNADVKDGQFVQSGPFTKEEVLELIQTGQAKYSDYIWKTGFSQWSRINEIDEFFRAAPVVDDPVASATTSLAEIDSGLDQKALLENVLKQVNQNNSLDFVENFPDAIEPQAEVPQMTEPLIAVKATEQELDFVESSAPESESQVIHSEQQFALTSTEPPPIAKRTSKRAEVSLPKFWSQGMKQKLDRAAQGTFLPWLMLGVSLAVTGTFAVWYFTQGSENHPSASMAVPTQNKPVDTQRPSISPKKENASQTTPKAASISEPIEATTTKKVFAKVSGTKIPKKSVVKENAAQAAGPNFEKVAQQFQKKAEILDRQYIQLKSRPFEWKRFYTNWKQELSEMENSTDLSVHKGSALAKKLTFGKKRLVQRAKMMDQSIVSETAVSSDFEEENVPQIFRDIRTQSRSKK